MLVRPPLQFQPNGPLTPLATFQARPITDSINRRTDRSSTPLYNEPFRVKVSGHTIQAGWELTDALTLRSITAFRKTFENGANQLGGAFSLSRLGAAGLPIQSLVPGRGTTSPSLPATTRVYAISGVVSYDRLNQKQESQEFQLVGSFPELEFVAGAYYFHERVSDTRQTFLSIVYADAALTQTLGTNPFTVGTAGSGLTVQNAEPHSYAGFAQATYSPGFFCRRPAASDGGSSLY